MASVLYNGCQTMRCTMLKLANTQSLQTDNVAENVPKSIKGLFSATFLGRKTCEEHVPQNVPKKMFLNV